MKLLSKDLFTRVVSFVMVLVTMMSLAPRVFAHDNSSISQSLSSSETWVDENGNTVLLNYSVDSDSQGSSSHAALYINGVLAQETYVSPNTNSVTEYIYPIDETTESELRTKDQIQENVNPVITEYQYTDLINDISTTVAEETNTVENEASTNEMKSTVPFPVFVSSGWAKIDHWDAAPASPYAIDLYMRNYDDEPDLHPFEKKQLSFAAKVAVTTVAGVLASFLTTGGITLAVVLKAFGAAIIKNGTQEVINKAIKGTVCYSTQKISYAPVVEGYNIYPNAYMTRLWLVAGDAVTGGKNYTLLRDAYEYSPQPSTTDLMYAARHYFTDWANNNGYTG